MRKTEKVKKLTPARIAIILAVILLISVAASLTIYFTLGGEQEEVKKEPPTPLEGESLHYNYLIAYPTMEEKSIQYISVENSMGSFGMVRPDKDGNFTLFYKDTNGKNHIFNPSVADLDFDFEYSDLFAIETSDGYGAITKLSYLCMALQLPYFEERIELVPEEREAQLDAYGLKDGEYETVKFTYLDEEGKEKTHTIKIGDKTVIGTGYYFTVDDRNYVYAGFSSYFEYALMGFNSFVKPILISGGLSEDTVISGYITTNYKQWLGQMHKENGDKVEDGSKLITFANTIVPAKRTDDFTDSQTKPQNGYLSSGYQLTEFKLYDYKGKDEYKRMLNALVGKTLGDYSDDEILVTVTSDSLEIDFGEKASMLYEYSVVAIESVITDTKEYDDAGTPVGENNLVKISYNLKIDGKSASDYVLHAVVDLENEKLPRDFVSAMRASSVGSVTKDNPINFSINYTKDNAVSKKIEYVITQIVAIYDSKGKTQNKIGKDSIVSYRYKLFVNGVADDEYITTIALGKDDSASGKALSDMLQGLERSKDLSITVETYTEYCEQLYDFISYSVKRIDYYVSRKIVSSFRYLNKSERDPYYGESLYENTMENKYAIYGLSNAVCQNVVNILTGISSDTSKPPEGLAGTETVAVGITPEVMKKYGLYAYEIYFEMPRGLFTDETNTNLDEIDDYDWYDTLGFTLYISEELEDGTRYVGSDLYDIVAKVDGAKFVFLDYEFVNFWARQELMITDVNYLEAVSFESFLEDAEGHYDMDLNHREVYWGADGKRYTKEPENMSYSPFDEITVKVTPFGNCIETGLGKYMAANGYDFVSLTQYYNNAVMGGGNHYVRYDPMGTSNFKELIENIYFTGYDGIVPAEEQADIIANSPMIFRMSFKLSTSAWRYVYEFYRYDDGRVLVRLYQASYDKETHTYTPKTTPVSDFYISSFAMKKIVNNFYSVMNGVDIDKETPYN